MERLGRIAGGTEIRTAFTDSDLKFGDDFPARLTKEINEADVVIVVIGPHWHGFAEDGAARIRDPEDWVGREVTMALIDKYGRNKTSGDEGKGKGDEKLIVPVMVTGSEPLRAADLLPEHHKLPELNWVQFDDEADLDRLAEEVAKHLGCLDEARDRVEGLNERITSTPWRPTWSTLLAVVAAAVAGGLAGWFLGEDTSTSDEIGAMQTAWWAGACVVGVVYTRSSLERSIRVDWKIGFQTTAIAVILVALTVTSFAAAEERNVLATLLQAFAGVALLSPWIFAMVGPGWSQSIATSLKGRAGGHRETTTCARRLYRRDRLGVGVGSSGERNGRFLFSRRKPFNTFPRFVRCVLVAHSARWTRIQPFETPPRIRPPRDRRQAARSHTT